MLINRPEINSNKTFYLLRLWSDLVHSMKMERKKNNGKANDDEEK